MTKIIRNLMPLINRNLNLIKPINALNARNISVCNSLNTYQYNDEQFKPYPEPKRWPKYNLIVHPPQTIDSKPLERYYCHHRSNVKHSPKKMWYFTSFVRGMSVDEAVKQLSFIPKKGAQILKEVILEAQEIAVREQNFQYKTNMWIGEAFSNRGLVIKGLRKHARMRFGEVRYFHSHIFLKLIEGEAPDYGTYIRNRLTGKQQLEKYMEGLRQRKIEFGV